MTALAAERSRSFDMWKHREFTLASGNKAYKGGRACISPGTGKVVPASSTPGLIPIGIFDQTVDATAGDKKVSVDLERELVIEWFVNDTGGGNAVAPTDLGSNAFMKDDQTVTMNAAARSIAGRIWAVDTTKGVAIEKFGGAPVALSQQPGVAAFTANDWAPASLVNGATYDVPATGAASTITLPAAAPDGTIVYFAADGTKNAHTVQYRDGTGPTNITAALSLGKRHLVVAVKRGGLWFANAYVSP
jgi:hypothetical protein